VFARFTEQARQVVILAQDEAQALKHNYIGTEHLLLGLLREEEGTAARVLDSNGITVEAVRAEVVRLIGEGEELSSGMMIPFTTRAKRALEGALKEAFALRPPLRVDTEHILLGLVGIGGSTAESILGELGTSPETARAEVLEALGH
jgi:ATP-dependent Clp protease ATP-binding subunit ClpC